MPRTPKAIVGIVIPAAVLLCVAGAAIGAEVSNEPQSPEALGFKHYYKCPNDADVLRIGDTVTPQACLQACENQPRAAGCWWLDGTGGFPRQCRVCKTLTPRKKVWPNDWATPIEADSLISLLGQKGAARRIAGVAAICNSNSVSRGEGPVAARQQPP
jgi:hypothetical protein